MTLISSQTSTNVVEMRRADGELVAEVVNIGGEWFGKLVKSSTGFYNQAVLESITTRVSLMNMGVSKE